MAKKQKFTKGSNERNDAPLPEKKISASKMEQMSIPLCVT